MNLNKLRIFQMIQSALAKKGVFATVTANIEGFCCITVCCPFEFVVESEVTESELLEWHAEIERV